jgi:hypothetical protein
MADSPDPHLAPEPRLRTWRSLLSLISALLAFVFPLFALVVFLSQQYRTAPLLRFLAVLSPFSVVAIIGALVIGHLAVVHAKRDPSVPSGQWLATTGLVLGYLSLALLVLWIGWLFYTGAFGE